MTGQVYRRGCLQPDGAATPDDTASPDSNVRRSLRGTDVAQDLAQGHAGLIGKSAFHFRASINIFHSSSIATTRHGQHLPQPDASSVVVATPPSLFPFSA